MPTANALRTASVSAINMLQMGLAELEAIASKPIPPEIAEDTAASLRTILHRLEKSDKYLTEELKAFCLNNHKIIVEGAHAIGTLSRFNMVRLDVPKVQDFLGKQLPKFSISSEVIKFIHKPK